MESNDRDDDDDAAQREFILFDFVMRAYGLWRALLFYKSDLGAQYSMQFVESVQCNIKIIIENWYKVLQTNSTTAMSDDGSPIHFLSEGALCLL